MGVSGRGSDPPGAGDIQAVGWRKLISRTGEFGGASVIVLTGAAKKVSAAILEVY